ncbi:MAG: hypothetical protein Q6373_016825 [Candidatus Sigynarchaeota archaeon]
MSQEPEFNEETTSKNELSMDPRKDLYDETLHSRARALPVRREISRNTFNKFDDFIAGVCDDTYSNLVEYRLKRRSNID